MKKKELLAVVEKSSKTYEEVLLPIMPGEKLKPEFYSE